MSKTRLYIHSGTFKTGTTALQNFLAINSDHLATKGLLYHGWFDEGISMNHTLVASSVKSDGICSRSGIATRRTPPGIRLKAI